MVFSIWDVKKGLSLGQAVPLRPTAPWAHTLSNGGDICIWVLVPAGIPTGLGDVHWYNIHDPYMSYAPRVKKLGVQRHTLWPSYTSL